MVFMKNIRAKEEKNKRRGKTPDEMVFESRLKSICWQCVWMFIRGEKCFTM
ncbi:hypothetical protein DESPIG_00942 [Desulfovibrio piger ATCC 29098]|uniref:Uncharacterized protein n=1 Tax=Desulfovibrio piger ATCC 29098 TaxID=411464 RepID=B6WS96_9BACT|nr:hypothetical protein DESPIG_00942 [Desulfovibrio piger ATCC 29098]